MTISKPGGFTLVELVTVIVIAGILSAIVYNRINVSDFTTEGSTDEAKSAVRYAQKLAVAQRRNVYVDTSGNDVRLCYDSACTSHVIKPPTAADWFKVTAAAAPTLSSAFYFDTLGRPTLTAGSTVATSAITLSVSGATRSIAIEPQTGFVH
ncbi:MAG TPA: prepilin-type N-terminal cleavage/methylation domain-containing protein [Burkholderiales bacterium]|nr:prepilin-type N-terminal cleavage/methylation domain-containing protein [Burkholderiales bacterium]